MNQGRVLSAIQPTSAITLGNILGALIPWTKAQAQNDCYFMAVDLHALVARPEPELLKEHTLYAIAAFLALGLDPQKSTLFLQSRVPEHSELSWILNCHTYMGELSRMTQYKDKSSRAGANIPCGLFNYPVLMAADILLHQAQKVPVGADQKQHIELTRDIAMRFNSFYGKELFTIPEPHIGLYGARVMDLQDPSKKMSKSAEQPQGVIFLTDDAKSISQKFKRAVTDSANEITYEEAKPGLRNLLEIQAAVRGLSPYELVSEYQGKMYGHLKVDTAERVIEWLRPVQEKTNAFLKDRAELLKIIERGSEKARQSASLFLKRIKDTIGIVT